MQKNVIVSTQEKLIHRFRKFPKDFTFEELVRIFSGFGFSQYNKGKTSGSRVRFINIEKGLFYNLHKPHPGSIIKPYALKDAYSFLRDNGFFPEETNIKKK